MLGMANQFLSLSVYPCLYFLKHIKETKLTWVHFFLQVTVKSNVPILVIPVTEGKDVTTQ